MARIEAIHLNLKDYCKLIENCDYHFRNNATSRMFIKDNKIWKFDDWQFFSVDSPVIEYRKELEQLNANVLKELIYLEENYTGYTIPFIHGFDLANPVYPLKILEYVSKDTLRNSYETAKENLNKIGMLGFDLSGDLVDRNIMFNFETRQFHFIDFHLWKHYKLDTKNNPTDLITLEKIKAANASRFEYAMEKSKILEKIV